MTCSFLVCASRESPVDCSVTKRSRHMSNDGGPMPYQPSYPEPRISPQTTTPSSSATEEKRVIVPAGEFSHSVTLHQDQSCHEMLSHELAQVRLVNNHFDMCSTFSLKLLLLVETAECNGKNRMLKVNSNYWCEVRVKFNNDADRKRLPTGGSCAMKSLLKHLYGLLHFKFATKILLSSPKKTAVEFIISHIIIVWNM